MSRALLGQCKGSLLAAQTFRKWREERKTDKEKKEADAEIERKRKGILTGREIFMEVSLLAAVEYSACQPHPVSLRDHFVGALTIVNRTSPL